MNELEMLIQDLGTKIANLEIENSQLKVKLQTLENEKGGE